jgi:hypothetical protein
MGTLLLFMVYKKYIDTLQDFDVVYGGRLHPEKCPSNHQNYVGNTENLLRTNLHKPKENRINRYFSTIP